MVVAAGGEKVCRLRRLNGQISKNLYSADKICFYVGDDLSVEFFARDWGGGGIFCRVAFGHQSVVCQRDKLGGVELLSAVGLGGFEYGFFGGVVGAGFYF